MSVLKFYSLYKASWGVRAILVLNGQGMQIFFHENKGNIICGIYESFV